MKNIKAKQEATISVCTGTGGIAAGGFQVLEAFRNAIDDKGVMAKLDTRCRKVGCRGFCAKDVLVDVALNGQVSTYQFVKPEMVPKIVDEHIVKGNPIKEWLVGDEYVEFHNNQQKLVLEKCGRIDPESIDDYMAIGGYKAAEKVLAMEPEAVIDIIKKSELRGRGGAGFPTGIKWESCRKAEGKIKYVLCNADEGDPGAFMDRSVLEADPHAVLEGMIIAAKAIDARRGIIYARTEYPLAIRRLGLAIEQARELGLLGEDILGTGFDFDIEIYQGAGAFVCGEETALMRSIEGKRGMPRPRPPFPAHQGLWEKPTILNNVETLANIGQIILKGGAWYASVGTESSKGTKVFALSGDVNNIGLVEVPMGTSLRTIVYDIGGGIPNKKKFKAVQLGGPSGGCVPEQHLDTPVDYEAIAKVGAIMGSGGAIVMDENTCMVDMARFFMDFVQDESCGKCTPCREGTRRLLQLLDKICGGQGEPEDLIILEELSDSIKETALCGLGQTGPNPVLSTLRYFKNEYEAHIYEKRCPAKRCVALLKFEVNPDMCTKCGLCFRSCPADAITWKKKEVAWIDRKKCIECMTCFEKCRFDAIF
jgi:NADH-quinone oxidoreductase subunit F/NAD(P)H dehydrogenase (quinone)/NADP-reducing hydrogenase subunit HndC